MAPRFDSQSVRSLATSAVLASAAMLFLAADEKAHAQSGVLGSGDAITTRFSGLATGPTGQPLPDPNGQTVRGTALGSPGFPANGSIWTSPPLIFSLTARDTGQVFGIALDDAEPANAYLTASSTYGLYRNPAGDGWADGMWGPNGGPGTVWKLDGANNYRPVPFATLTAEDGRENGGAGLGGIAFDPWNHQLFVSDLETGLIHRVSLDSGETLQTFDHGLDGRSYFLDVPSGQYLVLDVVPDDPESAPRLADCTNADGAAAPFEQTPACWNYADFRRRVFGLGVQRDPVTDTERLYYTVWGGDSLGSDGWDTAGDDARTSVWSVLLDGNGGFDLTDVRREFIVPPLVPDQEGAGQNEAPPVTDIAFSSDGGMLLAERGNPAPDFAANPPKLVDSDSARVLLFVRNEDGVWEAQGRYDVGFPERASDNPPRIRANASGGVALGNGYTDSGAIDPDAVDATVWMSGDPLCAPNGPCIDRQTGQATVSNPVAGFQGTPVASTAELVPPAAAQPGSDTSGPATQPEGPLASYMVPADDSARIVGSMGDIALYRAEPVSQIVEVQEPPEAIAQEIPEDQRAPETPIADIAVAKSGLGSCAPGSDCEFEISVTNNGPVDYYGPIVLTDTIGGSGVTLTGAGPAPWSCYPADGNIYCQLPTTTIAAGDTTAFSLTVRLPGDYSDPRLNNCASVTWLGLQGRDRIRAVQAALEQSGYDPGGADGIMGPQTAAAISAAESAAGLPATGEITPELVDYLFGDGADQDGDASPANDQDCGLVQVDVPQPPSHQVQISSFHRRFDSVSHDPNTSAPYDTHDLNLSYFHRTWRSSLHDTTESQPIALHTVALSQFHLTWGSAFHDGVYTRFVPLHSPAISGFHDSYQSVLHDYSTSALLPTHGYLLSNFHRSWTSARHDGIVTRIAPLHWIQLSAFHRRFASGLHDRVVTALRPLHGPSLSNFHNFYESTLHDPYTSRARPLHQPAVSGFHRTYYSGLHDPYSSRARPGHLNNYSNFHRTFESSQHDPLTTRVRPSHGVGVSSFHRNNPSSLHNGRTTQRLNQHFGAVSSFHRNNVSGNHNAATSRSRPIHSQGASTFHRTGASQLHNAGTSRAAPIHSQGASNFHRTGASAQHAARTSQRVSPSHQTGVSNYHRFGQSSAHNSRNSAGVSPAHQPSLSSFHRTKPSGQHQARTSGAMAPAHNAAQSNAAGKPKTPAHAPAVSRAGTAPAHNPALSNAAKKPVHNQAQSNAARQPAHNVALSNAAKKPVHSQAQSNAAKQPAHNVALSNAAKKPVHNQTQSNAAKQPAHNVAVSNAAKQPAHNQAQSNAAKQPAHSPAQSNAAKKPAHNQAQSNAAKQPAHNVALSNAAKKPVHNQAQSNAAKKPAHSPAQSNATRKPVHNPAQSNAQNAQKLQQQQQQQQKKNQGQSQGGQTAGKKKHDEKQSKIDQQKKKKQNQ
jgi:Putative peptidoglycan binding domain